MSLAPYRVHKLIQDLMHDPTRAAAFAENPETAFDAFALTEPERSLLRDGSPAALHQLGVHPNLQMKYTRIRAKPAVAPQPGGGPLAAYLERLKEV
ncbi:MAG TPA: hypothetical protein VFE13_12270 [Caulobacteraceae bacterium]|jgi:hypothetical protein|nr:hypothetical protein [Caulobacteraceae bacterium]